MAILAALPLILIPSAFFACAVASAKGKFSFYKHMWWLIGLTALCLLSLSGSTLWLFFTGRDSYGGDPAQYSDSAILIAFLTASGLLSIVPLLGIIIGSALSSAKRWIQNILLAGLLLVSVPGLIFLQLMVFISLAAMGCPKDAYECPL